MEESSGWEQFFSEVNSFVSTLQREDGKANFSFSEYAVERLEVCIGSVLAHPDGEGESPSVVLRYHSHLQDLKECLQVLYTTWCTYLDRTSYSSSSSDAYSVAVVRTSHCGRPKFEISKEQIEYLRSLSFTWQQISELMGFHI